MTASWKAVQPIRIGPGWAQFYGQAGDTALHAHHAVQICIAQEGHSLTLETPQLGLIQHASVIVDKHVTHRLLPADEPLLLIYLDPESAAARAVKPQLSGAFTTLDANIANSILTVLNDCSDKQFLPQLTSAFLGNRHAAQNLVTDPQIHAVLAALPDPLPGGFGLSDLARLAHLSPSRFAHRIKALTGLPTRPYLRWRRLLSAVEHITQGQDMTQAALAAGFSDAAHFSRSFKREFGITPRTLMQIRSAET